MKRQYLILCVLSSSLHRDGKNHLSGFCLWSGLKQGCLNELICPEDLRMIPRDLAENDDSLRQLTGYAVLKVGDLYAHYARNGTESRLHGSRSLGFGGHIEFRDLIPVRGKPSIIDVDRTVEACTEREVKEETGISEAPINIHPLGLLVMDEPQVSRVHLGVVTILEYASLDVVDITCSDGEIHEIEWSKASELKVRSDEFEGWSKVLLSHL